MKRKKIPGCIDYTLDNEALEIISLSIARFGKKYQCAGNNEA